MSVTFARGFAASGVACGIKGADEADLALVASTVGAVATAAVFTTNAAAAAPVEVSRAHLAASRGRAAGVLVNSGCANAATGEAGRVGAEATTRAVASLLGVEADEILCCSTGHIGAALDVGLIEAALPGLVASLRSDAEGGQAAAEAILTSDTCRKEVAREEAGVRLGGMAKGAGMIAPSMATMLAVLTTDADAGEEELGRALREGVSGSFNSLIIDACTSTNDTVVLMSSGLGGRLDENRLTALVASACSELAGQIAADAEGATKVVEVRVSGARDDDDARRAARCVASSLLVKTSLYGADPYWGRIVSELGASGATVDMARVSVAYGGVRVVEGGVGVDHDRRAVSGHVAGRRVEISCELGVGDGSAVVLTTDLGHGYIDTNMVTS